MAFCDHTGPKSSQTCHTSKRVGRQWELMWAKYLTERPSGACFHCQAPRHVGGSPQKHPPDPPCRPDGAEGFRLASSQNTASSNCGGRAGKKTNLDWRRLTDSTQRPHRAPVCVTARAGSSSSHPQRQTGGGAARCRTQPCTIPRLRGQTARFCLRHPETP